MFKRILIANRGEIALRVLRACKELGVETVCVFSKADADAVYLRFADETVCIGDAASASSYLNVRNIISAALVADADAIHPGYGFLSENAKFAERCESSGLTFIGPRPETIALVGDKAKAKELARKVGVPVIPGSDGVVSSDDEALRIARDVGFPVLVKAAAGGGGRGMRVAADEDDLVDALAQARREAEAAFGDDSVYIEKVIERPRHIEIQVLADAHGNVVHLGERDCSIQRRHQKLLEEAPSPALDPKIRRKMGEAARRLMKACDYVNAGTVEFLYDGRGHFYFMEINARLQVEHPVTEMVTGVDVVKEQIRIAAGERLGYSQKEIGIRGHAIEFRINAEDPLEDFRPSPGEIRSFFAPGGPHIRWDSHVFAGYRIPPNYDSMIGKLVVYGRDRDEALAASRRALEEFVVVGVKTTLPLFKRIVKHPRFRDGEFDTSFLDGGAI